MNENENQIPGTNPVETAVENQVAPQVVQPAASIAPSITLDQMINLCIEKEASDIHFREGGRLALRTGGKIVFIENVDKLSTQSTDQMIDQLLPEAEKNRLRSDKEVDFSYTHSNGVNFRVNVFYQRGKRAGVMRMVSKNIPTLEEIGVPETMKSFLQQKAGLILVCGPAGSGKSTTIQSMLNYVNQNFVQHILTIEDPIEYMFEDAKSIFTQREVGKDTHSMIQAINSANREDTNVVMVSEIRNFETFDQILSLVETGHLVITAMPTKDSIQTLDRLINMCPADLRKQTQERIANNITAILAQDLLEKQDKTGLIPIFELMIGNQNIRSIIEHGNLVQLKTAMQSASQQGMITMDNYAYRLVDQGLVSQEQIAPYIQTD